MRPWYNLDQLKALNDASDNHHGYFKLHTVPSVEARIYYQERQRSWFQRRAILMDIDEARLP